MPVITRIQPLKPRGLRVLLHLEGEEEPLEVTLEAIERRRLGIGDELSPDGRRMLLNLDADVRVRDAALNLISYRARTRSELARRLRQKGFRPARIEPCLDRLEERGFIDDDFVAAAFVRDRIRHRPRGRAALSSELRAKGVDVEAATRAIDHVFATEETSDLSLAREVAAGWVKRQPSDALAALTDPRRTPERQRAHRRLTAYLGRRGFRGEALGAALQHALALARDATG